MVYFHSIFLVFIACFAWLTYAAFFRDWGAKHFDSISRSPWPGFRWWWFLFSPKSRRKYAVWYTAWVLFYLVIGIFGYVLFLISAYIAPK